MVINAPDRNLVTPLIPKLVFVVSDLAAPVRQNGLLSYFNCGAQRFNGTFTCASRRRKIYRPLEPTVKRLHRLPRGRELHALTITSFVSSISPGSEDTLRVHSSRPDDTCILRVVLLSGYVSESRGLGSARANAVGSVTWTWEIGPNTGAGTALATIACGAGTLRRGFTIR